MIVASLALFVALGGPAQAGRLIDGREIRKGTVTSRQVKDRSLTTRDLTTRAVRALRTTPRGSITTRAFVPGSVLSGTVGDNSLTAADLASSSVGPEEVADNAIGQAEIRPNGVGLSEIADNSIDGGKVVDGALSVRDVARAVGTFEWPVDLLLPGTCQVAEVTISGPVELAGAFVLASPRSSWPSRLVYTVNGTNASKAFKIQACNRSLTDVAGATYQFNFAVLGF
jgi:hypothetical protein